MIGKGGEQLKRIASEARQELEQLFDGKVFSRCGSGQERLVRRPARIEEPWVRVTPFVRDSRQRVELQSGFVLHTHPWRETSLIVELFSRDHGRVPMVAKDARRPASALRGVLMAFQPLLVDWSGGGEVKTLARAGGRAASRCLADGHCCVATISTNC